MASVLIRTDAIFYRWQSMVSLVNESDYAELPSESLVDSHVLCHGLAFLGSRGLFVGKPFGFRPHVLRFS